MAAGGFGRFGRNGGAGGGARGGCRRPAGPARRGARAPVMAGRRTVSWFPGHMAKALREMQAAVRRTDLIVEVRDARLPVSSSNPALGSMAAGKKRLILLNKADLAPQGMVRRWQTALEGEGVSALPVVAERPSAARAVLRWARRHARPRFRTGGSMVLIVGMPNVGKSTLVNTLRGALHGGGSKTASRKVAATGPKPGVTRQSRLLLISRDPLVHVVDTPGVFRPRVDDYATGMKLALVGCVREEAVGLEAMARALLEALNAHPGAPYAAPLGLGGPKATLEELLEATEAQSGAKGKHKRQAVDMGCRHFIDGFRAGRYGGVMLDDLDAAGELDAAAAAAAAGAETAGGTMGTGKAVEAVDLDALFRGD